MGEVMEVQTENNLQYKFYPVCSGSVHFKVRAPKDAHIALTTGPQETDPMVEVFIGGWDNTKSVIRRNKTKPDKVEIETPRILNAGEFRDFHIRWDGGVIGVYRKGEREPFISWEDPEPFPITFVGVCTGWGATGTWKIEDGDEFDTANNLEYKFKPAAAGYLEFGYRGPHNCHVCLTSTPGEEDPIYEIILGGWENTKSVLRLNKQKPEKVEVATPGIMNPNEYKELLVQWRSGRLTVRERLTGAVLMDWTDPAPFPIAFFGVRTGYGARGHWRINRYFKSGAKHLTPSKPANYIEPPKNGTGVWVDATGGQVPPGAVAAGKDQSGERLFVARARHEGALIPGKLVPSHKCAYVPWNGKEHGKPKYQVLVGGLNNWVPANGPKIPPNAFPAGETETGEPLFVGRVHHEGSLTTGKVHQSHKTCYISFAGKELGFSEYEVLVA